LSTPRSGHALPVEPRELLGGASVLSRAEGPHPATALLAKKLALLSDGRLLLAAASRHEPDVQTYITRLKRQNVSCIETPVEMSAIAAVYQLGESGASHSLGNNSQATKLREIITHAASQNVTDIHWVAKGSIVTIFFRIDGSLQKHADMGVDYALELVRAAYNAHSSQGDNQSQLQITLDQDGRITSRQLLPQEVAALRLSSGPISEGWEQVWRLTYASRTERGNIAQLGYSDRQVEQIRLMSRMPYGIVIVGGPTGSGKSTTLQTILTGIHLRSQGKLNIYTIEEPAEMPIAGARQHSTATTSESDEDRQASYIAAVRVMLRRDPNVVMFGEVRDVVTAELATRTALAGRLVFTTLHGNDVLSLMSRVLHDLHVPPMIATDHSVFIGYVSQSLVPAVCPHCSLSADEVKAHGHHDHMPADLERLFTCYPDEAGMRFVGKGCDHCDHTGFKGRVLVAEVLRTNPSIMNHMRNGDKASAMIEWLREGNLTKRMIAYKLMLRGRIDPLVTELHVGELAALDFNKQPKDINITLGYGYDWKKHGT
jgi:general secretion pathway protein E